MPSPELLDLVRANAAAGDEQASLGAECFDRMMTEGLFHILVPPELGGAGGTLRQWFDASLAVAHADASAGWIVAQGAVQNAWLAVAADERFSRDYFKTPQTIATSSAGRPAAELVDGVYVVRGARWASVSGCTHADFVGGMVHHARPGRSTRDAHGAATGSRGRHRSDLGHARVACHRQPPRRPRRPRRDPGLAHLPVARPRRHPTGRARQRDHHHRDGVAGGCRGAAGSRPEGDRGRRRRPPSTSSARSSRPD